MLNAQAFITAFVSDENLLNKHHDHQYQDVPITFTNLNSFATFSKKISAILCNRQVTTN